MTNEGKDDGIKGVVPAASLDDSRGYVVLPFHEADFQDFIKSLLGQPQSISKVTTGRFEIDRNTVRNLYMQIDQRITQQNAGVLAKFEAALVFSDNATVKLHSLEDLMAYNEPRDLVSRGLHLTWDYIVRFPDKSGPERQQISVSFGRGVEIFDNPGVLGQFPIGRVYLHGDDGLVAFRVEHTARTWGADIEALLTGFVDGLLGKPGPIVEAVSKKAGWIVGVVGLFLALFLVGGAIFSADSFADDQASQARAVISGAQGTDIEALSAKLEVALVEIASRDWSTFLFQVGIVFFVATVLGGGLLIWLATTLEGNPRGFVLWTEASIRARDKYLSGQRHRLMWIVVAAGANIALGVASNVLFAELAR